MKIKIFALFIVLWLALPIIVLAQDVGNTSATTVCWDEPSCTGIGGVWKKNGSTLRLVGRKYENKPCAGNTGLCLSRNPDINLQVALPAVGDTVNKVKDFAQYLTIFYKFFVAMIAVMSVVMIMWGGFKLIYRGGSAPAVTDAKETIFGAIAALVIALLSYSLLNLVNPVLVTFPDFELPLIRQESFGNWCPGTDQSGAPTQIACGADGKHAISGARCMGSYCPFGTGICMYEEALDLKPKCSQYLASGSVVWSGNAYVDFVRLGVVCTNDTYHRLEKTVQVGPGKTNKFAQDIDEGAYIYKVGWHATVAEMQTAANEACSGHNVRGYIIEVEVNDDKGWASTNDDDFAVGRDCKPLSSVGPDEIDWDTISIAKLWFLDEFPIASPGVYASRCGGMLGSPACESNADCSGGLTCDTYPLPSCDLKINRGEYPDR